MVTRKKYQAFIRLKQVGYAGDPELLGVGRSQGLSAFSDIYLRLIAWGCGARLSTLS